MEQQKALFEYCLRLADNNLILGHRLSEWCGHGPVLEQDIALINTALDLIGQSRSLYQYAGEVEGTGRSEDDLAYLRDVFAYHNVLLVEQPNKDFAFTLARQFFFDVFNFYFTSQLVHSKDLQLSAIAEKSLKEITYHSRFSAEWIIRLGDGTEESHQRIQDAIDDYWMYTGELFEMDQVDEVLIQAGIAPDLKSIQQQWDAKVNEILAMATLKRPESTWAASGGKHGRHSEHLGYILADMQFLQRAYPGSTW